MTDVVAGHYELLEKLGQGGMGEVHKARDTRLNRFVAIKSLKPDQDDSPDRRARLIREARAASGLNHPNIAAVFDIVSDQGRDFIVMEYIAGETLADKIARRDLRLIQTLKFAEQLASALACAHAAGLIHRDIKPSNIMVARDDTVKVLDFGLAKSTAVARTAHDSTQTMGTRDGFVAGTAGYMSPEQVCGGELDQRSDIFSFGVVLYEMLSGKRAFGGASAIEAMNAVLKEEPPQLPDTVPAGIRQIVADCLAKDREARFASARDLCLALRAVAAASSTAAPVIGMEAVARARRWPWLVWTLGGLVLTVALLTSRFSEGGAEPPDLAAYRFTPLATDAEDEGSGSWSRDGSSVAYLKSINGRPQVMLRYMNADTPVQLTRIPLGVYEWASPFFSPDGEQVYFIADDKLWSVAAVGGEPREVLAAPMQAATISPDGKTLAFWGRYEEAGKQYFSVWISSPPGAAPRKYEPAPFRMAVGVFPNYLRFSPDGSKLGLATYRSEGGAWLWVLPWPDGHEARPHEPFPRKAMRLAPSFDWMPDSRHVYLAPDLRLWMGDIETGKLRCLTSATSGLAWEPSVSPGGKRILFTSASYDTDILELPLDGSPPRPLLATARSESSPSWSATGDSMAFFTDRSGESEIWLRSSGGSWERPVVRARDFPDETEQSPQNAGLILQSVALSPDGKRLAYCRLGRQWVSPVSGGQASLAAGNEVGTGAPSWSPDSSSIVFLGLSGGRLHMTLAHIGSQKPPFLIPNTADQCASAPVWSPDGRWIACGGVDRTILLVSPDGTQRRRMPSPSQPADQGYFLVWSPDAETIYVGSSAPPKARLDAIVVSTERSRRIAEYSEGLRFRTLAPYSLAGSLSRDGKSIAVTVFNSKSDIWILDGGPQPRRLWFSLPHPF